MASLRESVLSLSVKSIRTKKVVLDEGLVVEVRSPSLGQSLMSSSLDEEKDPAARGRAMAQLIIQCSFDPEKNAPLFTQEDTDSILEAPADAGSWPIKLINAINELIREAQANAKN